MADVAHYMAEILQLLEEHRADHPQGFSELELQQRCEDLPLLGLKRAVEQLEAAGKVHRVLADVGCYRIALPDAELEEVPIGFHAAQ
jgi:hypothetical protein